MPNNDPETEEKAPETPAEPGTDNSAGEGAVTRQTGGISVDGTLEIEIAITAFASIRCIAADIAARVGDEVGIAHVFLAGDDFMARLAHWRFMDVQMDMLICAMQRYLPVEASIQSFDPLTLPIASMAALTELLSFFKADSEYVGQTFQFDAKMLSAAIAGQLLAVKIVPVDVDDVRAPAKIDAGNNLVTRIAQLLKLREALAALLTGDTAPVQDVALVGAIRDQIAAEPAGERAGVGAPNPGDDVGKKDVGGGESEGVNTETNAAEIARQHQMRSLITRADALVDKLVKSDGIPFAALLQASEVDRLAGTMSSAAVLTANIVKIGGRRRTWKHLFTNLFTGDQLSFSGGAAVAYKLVDLKEFPVGLLLSDVLFHATGNTRFPNRTTELSPSNLSSCSEVGFKPLPRKAAEKEKKPTL